MKIKFLVFILFFLLLILFIPNFSSASDVYIWNDSIIELPSLPEDIPSNNYIIRYDPYWKAFGVWVANDWNSSSYFYYDAQDVHCFDSLFTLYRCYDNNPSSWVFISSNEYRIRFGSDNYVSGNDELVFSTSVIYDQLHKEDIYFTGSSRFYINFNFYDNYGTFTTSYFSSDVLDWNVYIAYENADNFKLMNYASLTTEDNITFYYFTYDVYKNGTYYFLFENEKLGFTQYITYVVDQFYNDIALNLHLSTTEKTTEPIYILSNRYYFER